MRVLFIVQHFRQGWGGAPESIRLMARLMAPQGFTSDVYDVGRFHSAVETLDLLPEPGAQALPFDASTVPLYDAIVIAGPWQNYRALRRVLKHRRQGQPMIYLPRGGLAKIEFARHRDIKKWPYLYLLERRLLDESTAIVFSSDAERDHTVIQARERSREVVIPDFFSAPVAAGAEDRPEHALINLSFMAEIAPRKGLVPLLHAFADLSRDPVFGNKLRLVIAGSIRKGSEGYMVEAEAQRARAADPAAIQFIGPVGHADRSRFYADADIFLVPSLFESYGLTVLEGLSAGCAVVTGHDLGALQFLPSNERLSIAASANPADLRSAIHQQLRTIDRSSAARKQTTDYADEAIAGINRLALDRWSDLLG